jgi:sigma-E factor negative regulatory protein RseB
MGVASMPTMCRHRSPKAVAGGLLAAATLLGGAQLQAQEARREAPRTEAQWIQAVRVAAHKVNYSGTIVYQAGGEIASSRITHLFDGTKSVERIQTLDGKPREYIRLRSDSDDVVQCLIPENRKVLVERRSNEETFPALSNATPTEILKNYVVRLGPVERVAGLECQTLILEPRDSLRYGYRLWAERVTGLLLKAQTLNEQREVLEQIAFSDIRLGERIDRTRLKPGWLTDGWAVERSEYHKTDLTQHGWHVPAPAGFRRTKEVARRMAGTDALQVVFSDGLATLSVFIEPSADRKKATDAVQMHGPTSAYSRRIGEALVTVVGEVPPGTIRAVADSVEFRGPR